MVGLLHRPGRARPGPGSGPARPRRAGTRRSRRWPRPARPGRSTGRAAGSPGWRRTGGRPRARSPRPGPGYRTARARASGIPYRAQHTLRLACVQTRKTGSPAGAPNDGDAPRGQFLQVPLGQPGRRRGHRGPPQPGLAARGPAQEDGPRVARPPAPRLADQLHPHAGVLGRARPASASGAGSAASDRLVRPRPRMLDQQPGPRRLRRRRHGHDVPVVAFRAVLADKRHAGQPPISRRHASSC